jgi:hypothetical protein
MLGMVLAAHPGARGPTTVELQGGAEVCARKEDAEGAGGGASGGARESRGRAHAGEKTDGESESNVGLLGDLGREGEQWKSGRGFLVDVCVSIFFLVYALCFPFF